MARQAYNDAALIEDVYLRDLEGLNRLIKDRHAAGYDRKEPLDQFLILGRWHTDTCGNFGYCQLLDHAWKPIDPAKMGRPLPRVIQTGGEALLNYGVHSTSTNIASSCVPPARVLCRECGKGWTIDSAHDVHISRDKWRVEGDTYVGRTFAQLREELDARTDGHFFLRPEPPLRNDRFIDLTPNPKYPDSPMNKQGWVEQGSKEAPDWDYVFRAGDQTYAYVWYYTHKRCWQIRKARESREEFDAIFRKAGFPTFSLLEIPNEYCPCDVCEPWYVARLSFGEIKIGWRKRVISIDWTALGRSFKDLFAAEDTTKWDEGVHAWGDAKAIEYLSKIRSAVE